MVKELLYGINILIDYTPVKSLIGAFAVAAVREKSAHFCRYSCASYNIG